MSSKLLRAVTLATGLMVSLGTTLATTGTAMAQGSEADKAAAKAAYKQGTIKYNLGEWDKAIVHFKKAFESYPDASFLFNIAQSYRQAGNCQQGEFFYKRYLAIKPDASNKREVEGFIKDLAAECKALAENGQTPPPDDTTVTTPPDTTTTTPVGDGTEVADTTTAPDTGTDTAITANTGTVDGGLADEEEGPSLLLAYASVGSSFMSIGDLETKPQVNFTIGAGYPLQLGKITIDGGLLLSHTSVKWDSNAASGTAGFTAILANVGAGMEVANKIRVRGEFGFGLQAYSGLDVVGNVFVEDGTMASGALSSAALRVALGAEYELTNSLAVSLQPIVGNFSPAPDGIKGSIDNITSVQLLLGVGYRM